MVITIIVLLILAGVSIAMLTGENGILTQAQNAKNETEEARMKEETIIGQYESSINQATNTEAVVGEIVSGGNKPYTNNGTAIIPEGFMIVPGCEDVSQGLVISDNPTDTEEDSSNIVAKGNQFVWIPVINEEEYVRNTTYELSEVSAMAYTDTDYLPDGIAPTIPDNITDEKEIGLINEEIERDAVVSKGGFYISRYEAGLEETDTLVSKKDVTIWNNISQENCKIEAKKFINNKNIKSALCSGIQWDVMMNFLTKKDEKYNVSVFDPSRHVGFLANSGKNSLDKVGNIYDLEGNYWEYVSEKNSYSFENQYVNRGGSYYSDNTDPASHRYYNKGVSTTGISFRFVLYVM